ncbi:hypothetical protein [Desulfonatronum thiodismutans]|nr:hypothetical protein [Desulfonatronum thiodismutans]
MPRDKDTVADLFKFNILSGKLTLLVEDESLGKPVPGTESRSKVKPRTQR